MIPICQRQQHILRRRILAAEKPYVVNPQRREGIPRFNLADRAKRRRLFRSGFVRATAASRSKDDRHTFVLVQSSRKIRRCCPLVVWMRHNKENVHFVALVRQRKRLGLLCRCSAQQQTCGQRYDQQRTCESWHVDSSSEWF